jgi:methyl acetate hydrolase
MIDSRIEAVRVSAGLPGVAVIAGTSERILHSGAYGRRGEAEMTPDSIGRIASMTKAITSATALRVVAQGRMTLDGPIGDLIPELAEPQILVGFSDAGEPILRPAQRAITLRHLLTHSAGFGYDTWNENFRRYVQTLGRGRMPANPDELRTTPLLFEPGERWNYGINLEIAGLAVERAMGRPLAEVVADEITIPLEMADTSFLPGPEHVSRLIPLGQRGPDGAVAIPPQPPVPSEMPFVYGGGNLFSTAPDFLRFLQAVMRGELLPPALQAEFLRPQLPASPSVGRLHSFDKPRSNDFDLFDGMPATWSLGLHMNTQPTPQGRTAFAHGWAGVNNTYYWLDLTRGTCGVVLAQLLPFGDPGAIAVAREYEAAINGVL